MASTLRSRMRASLGPAAVACLLGLSLTPVCTLAAPSIVVRDAQGQPLAGAAVAVYAPDPGPRNEHPTAVMDQKNEQFVPDFLVIRTGTDVSFPNSDQVLHHVYSFSPAKQFELALYRGNEHPPVTFDHAGIVVLGCNIHDHMIGYVLVVDGSHFGFTDQSGRLSLDGLPNEPVKVTVWHPDLGIDYGTVVRNVALAPGGNALQIKLDRSWPAKQEQSLSWNGY